MTGVVFFLLENEMTAGKVEFGMIYDINKVLNDKKKKKNCTRIKKLI
jgi:hypothetical protein